MSTNKFYFDGLDELKKQLRNLPEELAGEASHVVEGSANGAAAAMRRVAAVGKTGRMRDRILVTSFDKGKFHAGAIVKAAAAHSHLWERGTRQRRTAKGANRGVMPAAHQFIPIIVRERKRMYSLLADMLRRAGFSIAVD